MIAQACLNKAWDGPGLHPLHPEDLKDPQICVFNKEPRALLYQGLQDHAFEKHYYQCQISESEGVYQMFYAGVRQAGVRQAGVFLMSKTPLTGARTAQQECA